MHLIWKRTVKDYQYCSVKIYYYANGPLDFRKMLFFEFYGYEKNSREIDVSRMYLMIWVITFYHLIAIAIIIMRLCAIVLHINAIGLSIPILVITFLTVTIQEITLKKRNTYKL